MENAIHDTKMNWGERFQKNSRRLWWKISAWYDMIATVPIMGTGYDVNVLLSIWKCPLLDK